MKAPLGALEKKATCLLSRLFWMKGLAAWRATPSCLAASSESGKRRRDSGPW